jgi:hypothetical protein
LLVLEAIMHLFERVFDAGCIDGFVYHPHAAFFDHLDDAINIVQQNIVAALLAELRITPIGGSADWAQNCLCRYLKHAPSEM